MDKWVRVGMGSPARWSWVFAYGKKYSFWNRLKVAVAAMKSRGPKFRELYEERFPYCEQDRTVEKVWFDGNNFIFRGMPFIATHWRPITYPPEGE